MRHTVVLFGLLSIVSASVFSADSGGAWSKEDLDVRLPATTSRGGFVMRRPTAEQLAGAGRVASEVPGLTLRWDGISGAPKWIAAPPGLALSAPAPGSPEDVARLFLRKQSGLLGLLPEEIDRLRVSSVVPGVSGGAHVHFVQVVAGLDVFDGRVNVNLGADGAVRSAVFRLYAGLSDPGPPQIGAVDAVRLAVENVYPATVPPTTVVSTRTNGDRLSVFDAKGFGLPPTARLVMFPEAEGVRLAWEVRIGEPTLVSSYRVLLDAMDGTLLFRTNLTVSADARVLQAEQPRPETEEFEPQQHQLQTIPTSTSESPQGWISGDGTGLAGNNATTHLRYFSQPGLTEPDAVYDYPYNTASSALVNAWWWANDAHDRFYALEFDEAAGNYQTDNFGLGGTAGDPMRVVVYPSGRRNNAFYHPRSVDGGTSAISFYWIDCRFCADHDGYPENGGERSAAFMRDTVHHEYAHGVTTRMVGGLAESECLQGIPQSGGLGEAWSDLFAGSFSDDPRRGRHWYEGTGWLRGLRHDLTYDDTCDVAYTGCSEHADGMIYGGALWDLRESMSALDPADGLDDFHRIVLDGLANTVCFPTMLDARDGMLQADTDLHGSAHHRVIWNVMAARGMGDNASSTGETDTAPVADFTVPPGFECTAPLAPSGLVATATGPNAVQLSYDAGGAAAVEIWREEADNPFDRPVRTAFTINTTNFVDDTVQGGKSYRYHVLALGPGGVVCRSAGSGTADATAGGVCDAYPVFDPAPTVTVGDPSCALMLSWSAAQEGCPGSGAAVVYNVYRADEPGFEPSDRLLLARTTDTFLQDVPPDGRTHFYLVLAQHGTLDDPPDHGDRGSSQLLRWEPGVPTLARTTVASWDFDAGADGWATDNSGDAEGGWVLVDPSPTFYSGTLVAPDEAADGTGQAWVTGDAGGVSSPNAHDCDGTAYLISPVWDGAGGATLLSFDYWTYLRGNFQAGMQLTVDTGTDTATRTVAGLMTVQPFETDGRHGWQRFEIDLATLVAPTSMMSVRFSGVCSNYFSEYGVDNVRVEQAASCARSALALESVAVDDSPAGWGNGNGVLEPGETAYLSVELANQGTATAVAPRGQLHSDVPGLLVHEESVDFPDIPATSSAGSIGPGFAVTAPSDWECDGTLAFELEFTEASGATAHEVWSTELGYTVTQTILDDDFETDQGWIVTGTAGQGRWERGDPVGSMDGGNPANPEDDSPFDTGNQCYVTANASPGADPNLNDVDGPSGFPILYAPLIDLTGYKRVTAMFDVWYYDNSGSSSSEDYSLFQHYVNSATLHRVTWPFYDPTNGWARGTVGLHRYLPMAPDVRLRFAALDTGTDHVVEMGVDNVLVEGEQIVCDALGVVNPPNGVDDTLRVAKLGGAFEVTWQSSPVDGSHDGAAYYETHSSGTALGGYEVVDTAALTSSVVSLDGPIRFILVSAVNPAGTSGDDPAP